ncbi:MAG: RluA family pseudouridine synthase [Opitutaceae bacterium]
MTDPEHVAAGPSADPGAEPIGELGFEVPEGTRDQRADKSLVAAFPGQSRAGLQRLLAEGLVRREGAVLSKSDRVRAGDRITITFPPPTPSALEPIDLDLEVLLDDREFLVINKPAGLTVHPGAGTRGDTLVHGLLALCRGQLSGIGGVERPGIVHRLDRETSGVLVVAKTDAAHRGLAGQFAQRSLRKEYLTLIRGIPKTLQGRIDLAISRHPTERHRMTTGQQGRSRPSLTEWTIERTFQGRFSLLRCRIHTGRTHQIRVHLSAIGHPVLGDRVYGFRPRPEDPIRIPRVMLHAALLEFAHPMTGDNLVVEAPLPEDFREVLAALDS